MFDEIKVDKKNLLDTILKNRNNHSQIVEEAKIGYIQKAKELFEEKLRLINEKNVVNLTITLVAPQNHLKEYDEAIEMLKWEKNDEIVLGRNQFNCLILDNWGWSQGFLISNVNYSSTASGCYYGTQGNS